MDEKRLEDKSKYSPKNVNEKIINIDDKSRKLFSNDPLFGLWAFPDECRKNISYYDIENI